MQHQLAGTQQFAQDVPWSFGRSNFDFVVPQIAGNIVWRLPSYIIRMWESNNAASARKRNREKHAWRIYLVFVPCIVLLSNRRLKEQIEITN
jgi:hypothetical protein